MPARGILTVIFLMIAHSLLAQSDTFSALKEPKENKEPDKDTTYVAPKPPELLFVYVTGMLALPSKEFRSTINNSIFNLAAGGSGGILFNPFGRKRASPILIGFDFGYLNYAIDYADAAAGVPPLKITYNVATYSLIGRLRPTNPKGKFVPFVDGLIGAREFYTVAKVDKNVSNILYNTDQPEIISRISDTGLNFGLGAGFITGIHSVKFTCRLMALWGRQVDYVIRHSVVVDPSGHVTYSKGSTTTSLVELQLGIQFSY